MNPKINISTKITFPSMPRSSKLSLPLMLFETDFYTRFSSFFTHSSILTFLKFMALVKFRDEQVL
jgi:hypothetical protein